MRNISGYADLILTILNRPATILLDNNDPDKIDEFLKSLGEGPKSGRSYFEILDLKFGLTGRRFKQKEIAEKYCISIPGVKKQIDIIMKQLRHPRKTKFFLQFSVDHMEELKKELNLTDSIKRLHMLKRTYLFLKRGGINTIKKLTEKTERDLLMLKPFSKKDLKEVREALKEKDLKLKE